MSYLIGILGVDGVGKTTQINLLKRKLMELNNFIVDEPKFSSELRQMLHRIAWANNKRNAFEVFSPESVTIVGLIEMLSKINNLVNFNTIEIFDKYIESYLAYYKAQNGSSIDSINLIADKFPKLDIKIYLKLDFNQIKQRIKLRNGGLFNNENEESLLKYKLYFDDLADHTNDMHVIDVTDKNVNTVHNEIIELVKIYLNKK